VGMVRRWAVGVIGTIAVLALLSGCAGQSDPPVPTRLPTQSVAPEPSTEPAGTPGPTPFPTEDLPERLSDLVTKPVIPDEAHEFTADGAAAFAQYVIDATNWAYATGDAAPLLDHCSEDSGYCDSVATNASLMRDGSLSRHGGLITIVIQEVVLYSDHEDALLEADLALAEYLDIDALGYLVAEGPGGESAVILHMTFMGDAWRLDAAGNE
ncbi:MAG: DUF6318 family protein, partial [Propioniciclava sp.]